MTVPLALVVTCTPWCHAHGHPSDEPCLSDRPNDTLTTPDGEAAHYLTSTGDNTLVQIEVTPLDGGCSAVEVSVDEAREWFTAGLAACDLAQAGRVAS
jgi:hypothetical protein